MRTDPEIPIMLLAIDLYEDFINEKRIAVTSVTEIEAIVEPDSVGNDIG